MVPGCLFEKPSGILVLEVPEEDILAHPTDGGNDPPADVSTPRILCPLVPGASDL